MNRRAFLILAAETGLMTLAGALNAQAAPGAQLFLEGWELALDEKTKDSLQDRPVLGFLGQNLRFEHLYLRLGMGATATYFHGFPTDPQTGSLTNFTNPHARLQVFAMNAAESEAARARHARALLPAKPITGGTHFGRPIEQTSPATVAGALLDMAAAINAAQIPYVAAKLKSSPTNSNAVAAALLASIGVCPAGGCGQLENVYPETMAPGINCGLAAKVAVGSSFKNRAERGAPLDQLLAAFRGQTADAARPGASAPQGSIKPLGQQL